MHNGCCNSGLESRGELDVETARWLHDIHTLLRANPPKGGDAEPRGYGAMRARPAEPPASPYGSAGGRAPNLRSLPAHRKRREVTMRRCFATLAASLLFLAGCGDSTTTPQRQIASIELSPSELILEDGAPGTLTAIVRDQAGEPIGKLPNGVSISWSSVDPGVAGVSQDGAVTPISMGETQVEAVIVISRPSLGNSGGPLSRSGTAVEG